MAKPAAGDEVGEYVLEEEIGRGTFGVVWRARHAVLKTVAAVKIPTDPDYIKNLRAEGVIQHQIDSPHIVRTLGIDPWHDPPYLTVEYVEGQSLRALLKDEKPLPVETAIGYAKQILEALGAAHDAGVIHRDLKPENILVTDEGVVKVTDFGLGRVEEATAASLLMSGSLQTSGGRDIAGTVEYMAPEQKRPGSHVDHRADLYSFGVVLFEMLTGMRPTGSDLPSDLNAGVPAYLDRVFRGCHCHLDRRSRSVADASANLSKRKAAGPKQVAEADSQFSQPRETQLAARSPVAALVPEWADAVLAPEQIRAAQAAEVDPAMEVSLDKGVTMKMVLIPAGTFIMGSPASEKHRFDAMTQHEVTLTKPFYMGMTEVTQAQWEAVIGTRPWEGEEFAKTNPTHAVNYVSWNDCGEFLRRLNAKVRGGGFRLPTEAEWEYACRAGSTTRFHYGDDQDYSQLGRFAWYYKNAWDVGEKYPHSVGTKKPNGWGLYDMHGNVWEWVQDWGSDDPRDRATDPTGPGTGRLRVLRGGSWDDAPGLCCSAFLGGYSPGFRLKDDGFRCARTVLTP